MILAALSSIDVGVLALYLLAMLGVGVYFSRQQATSRDFFLAGRTMGWFPVGLSLMATLLSALSYSGIPGTSYSAGLKFLALPLGVWLTWPLVVGVIIPLYCRLGIFSIYEYLEWRFDRTVRLLGSVVFVFWRLLWLGGVLYAPCKVLFVAADIRMPMWPVLLILGLSATAYTYLGGMKAVIWTDVIQSIVMLAGIGFIVAGVWWYLEGGPQRVTEVASELGRTEMVETEFRWDSSWTIWGLLPHWFLSMLTFFVADQISAQRFLTARNLSVARRSFLLNCLSVSIMTPALIYTGIALLAFYYDHPQAMAPKWVVNLDHHTGQPITYADRARLLNEPLSDQVDDPDQPLIDWASDRIDSETVEQLIAQRRLLRPNSKQPFETVDEVLDPSTGELNIDRLAMRRPPDPDGTLERGEVRLHPAAGDELMPRFLTHFLPTGIAGLILAALFAASMSSMDSGLNSISTLVTTDIFRQSKRGRRWLAARRSKEAAQLNEADELWLGRWLVMIIGIAATLFSLAVAQIDDIFQIMVAVVNTFGGPLMTVILLGVFCRRCNAASATVALISGMVFTVWMSAANTYDVLRFLWPFPETISTIWPLIFGVLFTAAVGYLAAFLLGEQKSKEQLRGLVVGIGKLGERQSPREILDFPDLPDGPERPRWK